MNTIKDNLKDIINIIGEDIEDLKIKDIESIYNKLTKSRGILYDYIISYRGFQQPTLLSDSIIKFFEEYYPVYKAKNRKIEVVISRHAFFFMMNKCAKMTLSDIGSHSEFNHKYDHTTVLHGVNTFLIRYEVKDDLVMNILEFAEKILDIRFDQVIKDVLYHRDLVNK